MADVFFKDIWGALMAKSPKRVFFIVFLFNPHMTPDKLIFLLSDSYPILLCVTPGNKSCQYRRTHRLYVTLMVSDSIYIKYTHMPVIKRGCVPLLVYGSRHHYHHSYHFWKGLFKIKQETNLLTPRMSLKSLGPTTT